MVVPVICGRLMFITDPLCGLNQLSLIKPNSERISTRKKIVLPPSEDDTEQERIRILELEAEALALELDLAA